MKKFARILVLVLAFAFALLFAACGRNDLPPEAAGKTVLDVAYYAAGFGTAWMEDLKARYEAVHPDVYIHLEADPDMETTIRNRLDAERADLADDLCVVGGSTYRYLVRNGYLTDLTSVYGQTVEGEDTVDDLVNQDLKEYFTIDGKVYGLPWQDSAMGIVYNANMFDQHPEWKIPQTMDEFFALCEQIRDDTDNTVHPITYCGAANQGYFPGIMENWLVQYAGLDAMSDFLDCETAEVYQAQEAGRTKVYQTVAKIIQGVDSKGRSYDDPDSRGYSHLDAQAELLAGNVAMVISGPWMQIEMSEYLVDYPGFRMGIMPTPHINSDMKDKNGQDTQFARTSGTGVMFVPALSDQKDLAIDFMKFMLTQESLERFAETTDGLTRPYTLKNPENCDFGDNYFASTVTELLSTHTERMIYTVSTSPIWLAGEASMWMCNQGAPVTAIQTCGNLEQALEKAAELAKEDYQIVRDKWNTWQVA